LKLCDHLPRLESSASLPGTDGCAGRRPPLTTQAPNSSLTGWTHGSVADPTLVRIFTSLCWYTGASWGHCSRGKSSVTTQMASPNTSLHTLTATIDLSS
jgi:hypothetical protein